MRYILLIYGDESSLAGLSHDDRHEMNEAYGVFSNELIERGIMRGGDELASTTSATTVGERGGEVLVTDGPFAETKEQLGGYFIVDVDDLDTAIELAKKMPAVHGGLVEIRPIVEG
jgi:hypothetical protein